MGIKLIDNFSALHRYKVLAGYYPAKAIRWDSGPSQIYTKDRKIKKVIENSVFDFNHFRNEKIIDELKYKLDKWSADKLDYFYSRFTDTINVDNCRFLKKNIEAFHRTRITDWDKSVTMPGEEDYYEHTRQAEQYEKPKNIKPFPPEWRDETLEQIRKQNVVRVYEKPKTKIPAPPVKPPYLNKIKYSGVINENEKIFFHIGIYPGKEGIGIAVHRVSTGKIEFLTQIPLYQLYQVLEANGQNSYMYLCATWVNSPYRWNTEYPYRNNDIAVKDRARNFIQDSLSNDLSRRIEEKLSELNLPYQLVSPEHDIRKVRRFKKHVTTNEKLSECIVNAGCAIF